MKNDFFDALMLSTHNEKHLQKIPDLDAECIMLNLEDGVSIEQKPEALRLCGAYLEKYKNLNKMFVVRVNALDDGGIEEIKYINSLKPDAIRVPKIKTSDDVNKALGLIDEDIELHLSIETAQAWKNLSDLRIDERVSTFYLGVLDLFADLGLSHSIIDRSNPTMTYLLSHFLITCKSIGVKPVSFVYQDYKNTDEFSKWLELEKSMGFKAKGCISPKQSQMVQSIFGYDELEVKKAKRIIKLFEANEANGITGFSDEEFGFIDEPIYKGAKVILEKHQKR
ncbi:HpcH/HpaI aldolase/citrate lyase family protein [Sulfurimonas lithotrophica]|nr:aldolase/citrate lyase family protein [Sulfurimonas lithotrophica]